MDNYEIEPLFLQLSRELDVLYERAESNYTEVLNSTVDRQLERFVRTTDMLMYSKLLVYVHQETCKI